MNGPAYSIRVCVSTLIMVLVLGGDCLAQSTIEKLTPAQSKIFTSSIQDTITENEDEILIGLLNSSLQSLAEKNRQERMTGGYVLLGLGTASMVGGAVTLAVEKDEDTRIVGYSLLGGGALLSGLSLVPFKVKSEAERMYAEFKRELIGAPAMTREKFYYWDRRFEELAEKSKRGRIIGGITTIVAGGVTSLLLIEDSGREQLHTFLWPAIGGATSLFIKSETERRYETYRRAKEDIINHSSVSDLHFGFLVLPEGGILSSVKLQF